MSHSNPFHVVVLGGGAAGFFAAIACAEENPACRVTILERFSHVLAKVRISGGGRCNVTHACFDPAKLVPFYPRGGPELRGPFSRFQPQDTVAWFESRGVPLKTEPDGRMFPRTDQSQTIIDCLTEQARCANVALFLNTVVNGIEPQEKGFRLLLNSGDPMPADRLILATGSNPQGLEWARALGHRVEPPVPSLFSFTVPDARLEGLAGLCVPKATLRIEGADLSQSGALLITHWGLSGPVVLKLSAWEARRLHDLKYQARLRVNWLPDLSVDSLLERLRQIRSSHARKGAPGGPSLGLPRRLWARLAAAAKFPTGVRWSEISNERLLAFARELQMETYGITGKSAFKEEFVTCGGVRLDEVDFRALESKRRPGLYFAGEILDIDGVTGGFNFQSAWTTGWIAGKSAARIKAAP